MIRDRGCLPCVPYTPSARVCKKRASARYDSKISGTLDLLEREIDRSSMASGLRLVKRVRELSFFVNP